jgi:hypothetical protein
MSEAKIQTAKGGPVETMLGQQWIVFAFSAWEEGYRRRLADALDCPLDDLRVPLLGDLRLLRNDVVHHRGIASARNAGRCKVLRWFAEVDEIRLDIHRLAEFKEQFPWTELDQLGNRC